MNPNPTAILILLSSQVEQIVALQAENAALREALQAAQPSD